MRNYTEIQRKRPYVIKKYKDPKMLDTVCDYINYGINNHVFDYEQGKQVFAHLSRIFGKSTIGSVNYEYMCAHTKEWDQSQSARKTIRFIIYMLEKSVIKDALLERFIFFKERIYSNKHIVKNFYQNWLFEPEPDKVYNFMAQSKMPIDDVYARYIISLPEIEFKASRIKDAVNKCFNKYKWDAQYTNGAVNAFATCMKEDVLRFWAVQSENTLTSGAVISYLKCRTRKTGISYFINVLNELPRKHMDNNINALISLCSKHGSIPLRENIIEMLCSDDLCRWFGVDTYDEYNRTYWIDLQCKNKKKRTIIMKILQQHADILNVQHRHPSQEPWCHFDDSCSNPQDDFSFRSYLEQAEYFSNHEYAPPILLTLTKLYQYILMEYDSSLCKKVGVPDSIFQRSQLSTSLRNGYAIVIYNPSAPIPSKDKWLICYKENKSREQYLMNAIMLDDIKYEPYKQWLKFFLWHKNMLMSGKIRSVHYLKVFLKYLYDLKTGKKKSIFTQKNSDFMTISTGEIEAFKNYIYSSFNSSETTSGIISRVRAFVLYLNDNGLCKIESGVKYNLRSTHSKTYKGGGRPIPDSDLAKLTKVIKDNYDRSLYHKIFYYAFVLCLETELRLNEILTLQIDCVKPAYKENEFIITYPSKTSHGEVIEKPITLMAKRLLDEAIKITEECRVNCHDKAICNYLLIIPKSRNHTYGYMNGRDFARYMKNACEEANIPRYSASNLRDKHMTMSEEYVIKKKLSDVEQSVLSGHVNSTTDTKHYVGHGIRELLESVHGVTIGDVALNGHVAHRLKSDIPSNSALVSNKCGYCSAKKCLDNSYLDCMLCGDFVTTIDRKPYFEERIKTLDSRIAVTHIPHDKEDLINIKRLLLRYLEEILSMEESLNEQPCIHN